MSNNGLLEWLQSRGDGLAAAIAVGVASSSVTAYIKGTRTSGVLISHLATAILVVVIYPTMLAYFKDDWTVGLHLGLIAGITSFSVFSMLMKLGDKITNRVAERGTEMADTLIDKVVPRKENP